MYLLLCLRHISLLLLSLHHISLLLCLHHISLLLCLHHISLLLPAHLIMNKYKINYPSFKFSNNLNLSKSDKLYYPHLTKIICRPSADSQMSESEAEVELRVFIGTKLLF